MYLLIILMPLLSSILAGFFGRKIGVTGAQIIACSLIVFTTVLALLIFTEIEASGNPVSIYLFKWIDLESLNVYFGFNFDSLTTLMLIPVLFVSSLVHIYSIGYMSHDPHNQRFFSYLSLFTFMMIILVTANNYLLMFVGWEGVGICSYLLVSFWFTRIAANQSSIAAILTNRVGDCFLTIGMFAIIWSLGNLDYATIFSLSPFVNENIVTIIGICLLIGAMAKSSQIGLHVWLPMAMEGPTPVSALIHAATMVTAGVYLLIRSSPLIEYSTTVLLLCLWIGAITSLISSLIGLFQQDIKKVIAYSTMSQLGIMVVAIGLSCYNIALFHLVNHAFYKALLFLGAGSVIHAVADKQDFRKYGGLKKYLPLSHSVMLIASLSLVAFPFMTGYFSKDFIIESCYGKYDFSTIAIYYIVTIGAMFTTLYSVKTLYLAFETNPNGSLEDYKNVHEGNIYMSLPLVILALFSVYFGFITRDMFIGLGSDFFIDNSIFIHPSNEIGINTEFSVPTLYKLLPFILTIILIVISFFISEYLVKILMWFKLSTLGYNLFSFFNLRFLIELLYNKYITENILKSGEHTSRILDRGAIELIGPYGLESTMVFLSKNLSSLDTGVVTTYAVYILMAGLTYLFIPYTYLLPISIFIMLFFIFVNRINVSSININLQNKQNLQSKIDYMHIVKRILKVTCIAMVMWFVRNIIIDIFQLHRQDLIDMIVLANISNILVMIVEGLSPMPINQGTNFENTSNNKKEVNNVFFSGRSDSNSSRNSSRDSVFSWSSAQHNRAESPEPWVLPQWEDPQHNDPLVERALQAKGQMVTESTGDEQALNSIGIQRQDLTYFDTNHHEVNPIYDLTGTKVVGVRSNVLSSLTPNHIAQHRCTQDKVFYPEPEMENQDNPQSRCNHYLMKARQVRAEMNIVRTAQLASDFNDPVQNQLETEKFFYYNVHRARAWEAFGIRNSVEHRRVLHNSVSPGQRFVAPPYSERFPERPLPGTTPRNGSNVSSVVTWGQ